MRSGGCLCGAVRYEVRGALRQIIMCHCTQCRRMTGHFMAATAARHADFRVVTDGGLKWFAASQEAQRGFCAHCGSTLFWQGVGRDYLSIAAGTLDDSSGLEVVGHIFVADKGPYYEIADGTPQVMEGGLRVPWS
jgi:hypothetical protein